MSYIANTHLDFDADIVAVQQQQQRERDAGAYLATRIEELEAKVIAQTITIEQSRTREMALHRTIAGLQDVLQRSKRRNEVTEAELAAKRESEAAMSEKVEALIGETQSLRARVMQLTMQQEAERKIVTDGVVSAAVNVSSATRNNNENSFTAASTSSSALVPSGSSSTVAARSNALVELRRVCDESVSSVEDLSVEELRLRLVATIRALNEAHGVIASILSGASGAQPPPQPQQRLAHSPLSLAATSVTLGSSLMSKAAGHHSTSLSGRTVGHDSPWLIRENAALSLRVAELEQQLQRVMVDRRLGL